MALTSLDWLIIGTYLVATLALGIYFSRRASASIEDFFVAGRKLPWWLAGTSIVATTFASDTPLMVSGFVRRGGIWENWFWWSAALGAMISVVFYAKLWRRSGIVTDLQFIELRYGGKAAASLRGFLAVYAGLIANCIGMGTITLAMAKLGAEAFGWPETISVSVGGGEWAISGKLLLLSVLMIVVLAYTITAGMWGVVATDIFEFLIAMFGAIVLMVLVYLQVGGPSMLVQRVAETPGVAQEKLLAFIPTVEHAGAMAMFTFIVYISVQWWASSSATSPNTQRMLATRDERQATYAALWGAFAHYVIRPWPWIIVGVGSLLYFPLTPGEDPEAAYPKMMMTLLPSGLRGLMMVAFLAAFMSTVDTRLNWGASYIVNDLYKRFLHPNAEQRHYVTVSRVVTLLLLILGVAAAFSMESIIGAWMYLVKLGSGAGLVVLLRWFWWRINAWSEISALAASFVISNGLLLARVPGISGEFAMELVVIVAGSTLVWVVVTFLTPPTDPKKLEQFYRTVRPGGWWGPVAASCPEVRQDSLSRGWPAWFSGLVSIYCSLFGLGFIALGEYARGVVLLVVASVSGWVLKRTVEWILDKPPPAHSGVARDSSHPLTESKAI